MIRSVRVVLCRTLLGVLDDRGIRIHAVAEATLIPVVELRRLEEFGSPLDQPTAERLIAWGMRMVVIARPTSRAPTRFRFDAERARPHVSLV